MTATFKYLKDLGGKKKRKNEINLTQPRKAELKPDNISYFFQIVNSTKRRFAHTPTPRPPATAWAVPDSNGLAYEAVTVHESIQVRKSYWDSGDGI